MTMTATRTDQAAEVRRLIDEWAAAARARDLDRIMATYTADVLAFDAVGRLQFEGAGAYREHWQACLEMCGGPMILEVHDLAVESEGELAWGHYLMRCGGTGPDGQEQSGWLRGTVCCRKAGGRWRIAHEHISVPFDVADGKAQLGLEP